jgi:hypothetical protein
MAKLIDRNDAPEDDTPIGRLLMESQFAFAERRAYKQACDLDSSFQHEAADDALRAAGIRE